MANQENKVKSIKVLDAKTLESTEAATEAATSRIVVNTYYSDQLNLACQYIIGAGETNNTCYIKVWGYIGSKPEEPKSAYSGATENALIKADTENWIQIGTYDLSSGSATFTASVFEIVGAVAATTYSEHFTLGITFSKIRVSAYESGVITNKGTLTVVTLIQ